MSTTTLHPSVTSMSWLQRPAAHLTVRLQGPALPHPTRHQSPQAIAKPMNWIFHRAPAPRTGRMAAVQLCHAVARAVFEVLSGYRSIRQLNFAMEPGCVEKIKRQMLIETRNFTTTAQPGTTHGCVRTIRMEQTQSGAYECAAVLAFKHRVRAVALRIEPWHGRWQVTELEVL